MYIFESCTHCKTFFLGKSCMYISLFFVNYSNKPPPVFLMFMQSLHIEKLPSPVERKLAKDVQTNNTFMPLLQTF